jgi:hypothetical protein
MIGYSNQVGSKVKSSAKNSGFAWIWLHGTGYGPQSFQNEDILLSVHQIKV